jgi:hypothetical protein
MTLRPADRKTRKISVIFRGLNSRQCRMWSMIQLNHSSRNLFAHADVAAA